MPRSGRAGGQGEAPVSSRPWRHTSAQSATHQVERALECVDQAFALFDVAERLVFCNGMYGTLLGLGSSDELIGRSHGELLERWIDELLFSSEQERAGFRAECLLLP